MSIHPTLLRIIHTIGLTLFLASPNIARAADLMDIFRSARDHDPSWEAKKLEYQADKQALTSSEALLYPKIQANGSISHIRTSGSGQAIINPAHLDEAVFTECLIQINDSDNCNPPLIIRDDLGGRYETYSAEIGLIQPLYNYKAYKGYQAAKIANSGTESNFEKSKQDLILSVAEAYFAVLRAYEQWEVDKAETETAEKQLEQTKKRFQLGLLPQNDVYDVRSARDSSKVKLLVSRTALENAQENLMLMTQRRDVSLATLSDDLLIEPPQPRNVEAWVKKGLTYNRSLLAAHSATLAAEQELAVKKGGFHPEINFIAGHKISKNDEVAVSSAPSISQTGVGVQFKYLLYSGGLTTAEVKAAHLNYDKSSELFELARRDVIRKVRNAYRKVNNDVKGVEAAEQAIHSSEKSLEAAQAGYRSGTRPLVNVLKAQGDLFRAKKDHANARYNYILDSLRLKYEAGTLAIEDLQIINSWVNEDKLILPPALDDEDEVDSDLFY